MYRGAGPGEIETQVVKPIEDAVAGISGVDKIHSFSRENLCTVVVQFKLTANLDRSVQEVRGVAGIAGKLPRDADSPVVGRGPVRPPSSPTRRRAAGQPAPRKRIEDDLRPALAQLEGVAEVRVTGGDVREIQVDLDVDRARAVGINPLGGGAAHRHGEPEPAGGPHRHGQHRAHVRSLGEFQDVEALRACRWPAQRAPRCAWTRSPPSRTAWPSGARSRASTGTTPSSSRW